ncbi:MAG: DUF222 domain-containing protein [Salinibacterium sp.]|nr:DUF222 domain-containing protein [Salinibacterium sp.]
MRFISTDVAALAPANLADDALLHTQRELADARRALESASALVAAEIARRSSRDVGHSGLAARHGARSPVQLVQFLTGASASDANRLVRVGTLVDTDAAEQPWLKPTLGLDVPSVDAIRSGLGSPTSAVPSDALAHAARTLASEAPTLTIDALARRARQVRDDLDISSVGLREEERRSERFLRLTPLSTGMTRISGLLDPESAAIVVGAVDAITSPRRGGPRFVADEGEPAPQADPRTIDQLVLDALVDLVSVATQAPSGTLFGKQQPRVRVLVALSDLEAGTGAGYLEGQQDPVSLETVERHACTAGVVPLLFTDDGQGIDLGRDERYHSPKQRKIIAARDGGCRFPQCERPPGWCEVHHIVPWSEGGNTTVDDGVLLCRFHHLLLHNNGWRIVRTGARYDLIPPGSHDPQRRPISLSQKSPALRRLLPAVAS